MADVEPKVLIVKAYYKLCSKPQHRQTVLKDHAFYEMLGTMLLEESGQVMAYLVKMLLLLTETKEDAMLICQKPTIIERVNRATEGPFSLSILHNLMLISSRLNAATSHANLMKNDKAGAGEMLPSKGMGTLSRKFVAKKSKQLVYEFEELPDDMKCSMEQRLLSRKGVVSVYFDMGRCRVVIRTTMVVDPQDISDLLFDCGCEMITQIVRVDGEDEHFKMYASERRNTLPMTLPDYLDDMCDVADPMSCMITNDHAQQKGWFNTISSFVKLW